MRRRAMRGIFSWGVSSSRAGGLTAKSGESTWRGPSYDSRARNAGNPVGMVAGALCICCRFDGNASPDFANAHPGQGEALRVGRGLKPALQSPGWECDGHPGKAARGLRECNPDNDQPMPPVNPTRNAVDRFAQLE